MAVNIVRPRHPVLALLVAVVASTAVAGCTSGVPTRKSTTSTVTSTTAAATTSSSAAPASSTTVAPTTTSTTTATSTTTSPTSTTTTTATPVGGTNDWVYVLGDSVLLGTEETLPAALVGWKVTMDCVGSRRLPQGIQELEANRSRIGAVVVIQMGNNYIPGEDGTFSSQIDQAMQVLAGVKRVVWVTVAELWPSRVMINDDIRAAAAHWPTIRIADWAPIIAAHPDYAYDGLHLTPAGRIAMASLIASVVGPAPR